MITAVDEIQSLSHTPVCAIGAFAGGVAALKSFFIHVRADLGLAYIVVVHLAPDDPSALSEILAIQTKMPVIQIESKAKLNPKLHLRHPSR